MKKVYKLKTDTGIVQVTVADERWYFVPNPDTKKGLPEFVHYPSVTWISSFYYKDPYLVKWIANQGWDEAERVKRMAGDKGSKIHQAIEDLVSQKSVKMDSKYMNPTKEEMEELTVEEYAALLSFHNPIDNSGFWNFIKPKVILKEALVVSREYGYAGTLDMLCEIDSNLAILDIKTGQSISNEHILQLSAYKNAIKEMNPEYKDKDIKLYILQLGYRYNKAGWKLTEIEDKFNLFLSTKEIWNNEVKDKNPLVRDYPLEITLPKI